MDLSQLVEELKRPENIPLGRSFELTRLCGSLLAQRDTARDGRELVIRILDAWEKIPHQTQPMWKDLAEAAGLYPYIEANDLAGPSLIRRAFHKSKYLPEVYLHEEQVLISMALESGRPVVLSAPTSFGKSLLIEEVVASKKYKNIVVIQPTLALLDETREKLSKYSDTYKLVVTTSQQPSEGRNLFLLTAERVVEYSAFPAIDFFVIDEFYKLSLTRDDGRAAILNCAFVKLAKMTKMFYMLGPCIKRIPQGFIDEYRVLFSLSTFCTVA